MCSNSCQCSIKRNAVAVGLDLGKKYREQDPKKLAKCFKLVGERLEPLLLAENFQIQGRHMHPYLTNKCFPTDWAQAELVKSHLKNKRSYEKRCGRLEKRGSDKLIDNDNDGVQGSSNSHGGSNSGSESDDE